jgi:hypothetical protein
MPDTPAPSPEEIEDLEDDAEALEDRAEDDGLIPDDDMPEDGVGPQTGVVP